MDIYRKSSQARRAKQKEANSKVRDALSGLNPKTSGLVFDLSSGKDGYKANNRAHVKAMELVAGLIGKFALPIRPKLSFQGMVKNASDKHGNIEDGVVNIGVELHTLMKHRAKIDVPVLIRSNSLLEPAVFFHNGAPYVMCEPALKELVRGGSLTKEMQPRGMFSGPIGDATSKDLPRQPLINQENMYSPGARNPWTFKRHHNKEAQHKAEPRKRTNIDTPTEMPELWDNDVPDETLDVSERRRDGLYEVGAKVKLTEDFQARERGGSNVLVPKGEIGIVMKDMEGDGKILHVCFEEMGLGAYIPKRMLKNASIKKVSQVNAPEYIQETFLVEHPAGAMTAGYKFGASSSDGGMVFYDNIDGEWFAFDGSENSDITASKLNSEGWHLFMNADAAPFGQVSWSKTASVTPDQVKNEVRQMIREGYTAIDIKEAISRRFPEQAAEALQGLN